MITYTCKKCDKSFHPDGQTGRDSTCPHCHIRADEVFTELFWCDDCNIPLYDEVCPRCGKKGHHFTSDARPVFPEERLSGMVREIDTMLMENVFHSPSQTSKIMTLTR